MKGSLVAKRYSIIAQKGEGALSIVYRAHDNRLDRDVALKVLKAGPGIDKQAALRFDAEARVAAQIVHPNVASIYDVVDCEFGRAIAMEYVDGPSLGERLKVCHTISETKAVAYARQIADALAAAHARGLVHRDVKPGNILLTPRDEVKVVDFGLVKALDGTGATLTQTGTFVGSVYYISPEQAQGSPISPASDLYSLGIIIFQMVTGDVPFAGESPLAVALAHVAKSAPSRRRLRTAMSPALAEIVAKLLEKDPQRRYSSAADVSDALRALGEKTVVVPPREVLDAPTITAPVVTAPRPTPILVNTAAAAAAAASAAAAAFARANAYTRRFDIPTTAVVSGTLLLVALFLAFSGPAFAVVQNLHGSSVASARAMLTRAGLRAVVRTRSSLTVPDGIVLAQQPAAGARLRRGATVALVASSGPPSVTVPSVRGLPLGDARAILHRLNLQARLGAAYSSAPAYTVIEQAPSPGTRVRQGTAMMIVFAVNPAPSYPVYDLPRPFPHGKSKHHGGRGGD